MSGDTYRSENVIFADLHFPEKADNDDPLFVSAYYKVADVDEYDTVKKRIREMDVNWEWYDLIEMCIRDRDMGITKNVEIYVRKIAPLGDPIELTVRGYELSLRKADAEMIEVQ